MACQVQKNNTIDKKLKIAMIGHKRIPGREGGVEVVVEELATRMAALGHDVTVYNRKNKNIKQIKEFKGVKIKNIFTVNSKNLDAFIYSFISSICVLFHKYDIIHYHAIGPSAMSIIPHIFGKRIVVTVHGLNYKTPKWKGLGERYLKLGEKIVAKYANEIIVLSKEQQKYFKEKYNRDTFYIPNGVSIQNIEKPEIINKKYGLTKNSYILFLSRLVPGKGLETLISAYRNTNIKIPLIIAGETNYVNNFYNKILNLINNDERIKLIGFVKGKELSELFSNTRLFIFPSEAEGMAMSLLEALSYNTPCLVSNIPENKEVGKNYVQYFSVGDENDLREQLLFLTKSNNNFNENSREYILEKYNWEDVVLKTLSLYKK